jgi:hypothetical protein
MKHAQHICLQQLFACAIQGYDPSNGAFLVAQHWGKTRSPKYALFSVFRVKCGQETNPLRQVLLRGKTLAVWEALAAWREGEKLPTLKQHRFTKPGQAMFGEIRETGVLQVVGEVVGRDRVISVSVDEGSE